MKRCRKEPEGPECLSEFREKHPGADWERDFRAEARDCYAQLRDSLRLAQGGLCAYCETRLDPDNEQIAHFHPKGDRSPGHNWALDWSNLWLACKGGTRWRDRRDAGGSEVFGLPENRSCDEAKADLVLDEVILGPGDVPAFPLLFRFHQRPNFLEIQADAAACDGLGIPVQRAEETIAKLNLNCRRLGEARLAVHCALEQAKKKLRKSGRPDPGEALDRLAASQLGRDAEGCLKAFFTVSRWSLRGAAEAFLARTGFNG